jgi:hypothetical protein
VYKELKNEKGIALVTALIMMVLGFAVVVTLLLMVTQGTKITGIEQRYAVALDASKGGADFIINMIRNDLTNPPNFAGASGISGSPCLKQKLEKPTSTANWDSCSSNASTSDPMDQPDVTLALNNYQVFVKIVDTRETDTDFLYTINIRSQLPNGTEHAEISLLYKQEK